MARTCHATQSQCEKKARQLQANPSPYECSTIMMARTHHATQSCLPSHSPSRSPSRLSSHSPSCSPSCSPSYSPSHLPSHLPSCLPSHASLEVQNQPSLDSEAIEDDEAVPNHPPSVPTIQKQQKHCCLSLQHCCSSLSDSEVNNMQTKA